MFCTVYFSISREKILMIDLVIFSKRHPNMIWPDPRGGKIIDIPIWRKKITSGPREDTYFRGFGGVFRLFQDAKTHNVALSGHIFYKYIEFSTFLGN